MTADVDEEDVPRESTCIGMSGAGSRAREQTLETGRVETGSTGARYEIGRKLGRGGMADVFFARRITAGGFAKDVALKCVADAWERDDAYQRMFLSEARLASHLHHPGIAEAYDLEEIGGRVYLVLEFIDGVSVWEMIGAAAERDTRIPAACACYIAASIAEALHHAHTLSGRDSEPLGIVHRDLSRSNVMVTKTGVPKLLDFGVAFARMQGRDRTGTGHVRGTYAYLSPEQAAGRQVDCRSDLFSLGLLLVEMLTGNRVFDGGDDFLTAQAIKECSAQRVVEATRELPSSLQKVCRRALAKDPAGRFQSADELARALREVLAETASLYGARECAGDLVRLGLIPGNASDAQEQSASGRRRSRVKLGVTWLGAVAVGACAGALAIWFLPRAAPISNLPAAAKETTVLSTTSTAAAAPPAAAPPPEQAKKDLVPSLGIGMPGERVGSAGAGLPEPFPEPASIVRKRRTGKQEGRPRPAPAAPVPPVLSPPAERPADTTAVGQPGNNQAANEPSVPPPHGAKRSAHVGFADRGTVANAGETLPRGTLVRVRLPGTLDAKPGIAVDAVVTEDVLSDGTVLVPRGSVVRCRTGGVADERIGLSCDSLKAGPRSWTFSALALGDGERPGLRVEEGTVASRTEFVVFVSASAVLE